MNERATDLDESTLLVILPSTFSDNGQAQQQSHIQKGFQRQGLDVKTLFIDVHGTLLSSVIMANCCEYLDSGKRKKSTISELRLVYRPLQNQGSHDP